MTIRVAIRHNTYCGFDRPVNLPPHTVRLRPAPHSRAPIHGYSLKVEPANHFINWQQDAYGNYIARLVFPEKTKQLAIEIEVLADLTVINPFDFFVEEYAGTFPFAYDPQTRRELTPDPETLPPCRSVSSNNRRPGRQCTRMSATAGRGLLERSARAQT